MKKRAQYPTRKVRLTLELNAEEIVAKCSMCDDFTASGELLVDIAEFMQNHIDLHERARKANVNIGAQVVIDHLMGMIESGALKSGDILPRTLDLMDQLSASVNSIQAARDYLKEQGLVNSFHMDPETGGRVTALI